ncbi:hypothetical protein Q5762_04875 [Streptomyces sp. P9(2023)]|uniref:hypothetical protein n=1 Tax=Streptomyces sp. P9(2023) TaxID=3064394 RepID=UPI0028F4105F|nr:hypothetical protein [Streptomyces sp. P9(2023)]MDT9687689.1 hypothetical protein [Streptomyces sp. P9(2023)]
MDHEPARETNDADALVALIRTGGLWHFVPQWVPRTGYASPTQQLLLLVRDGLEARARRGPS